MPTRSPHAHILGLAFGDLVIGAAIVASSRLVHFDLIRLPGTTPAANRLSLHQHLRTIWRWRGVINVVLEQPTEAHPRAQALAEAALHLVDEISLPHRVVPPARLGPPLRRAVVLAEQFPETAQHVPAGAELAAVEPWMRTWNLAFAALAAAWEAAPGLASRNQPSPHAPNPTP